METFVRPRQKGLDRQEGDVTRRKRIQIKVTSMLATDLVGDVVCLGVEVHSAMLLTVPYNPYNIQKP